MSGVRVPLLRPIYLIMIIDRRLKQKFWNKRVNAEKENIEFKLSLEDYVMLMEQANITCEDLHIKGFHLSRKFDSGAYEIGNCSFVPYLENYKQKKVSEKSRNASRLNMIKINQRKYKNVTN